MFTHGFASAYGPGDNLQTGAPGNCRSVPAIRWCGICRLQSLPRVRAVQRLEVARDGPQRESCVLVGHGQQVLGSELFLRMHPDWRADQRQTVEDTCSSDDVSVWVAESERDVVGFVGIKVDEQTRLGEVYIVAVVGMVSVMFALTPEATYGNGRGGPDRPGSPRCFRRVAACVLPGGVGACPNDGLLPTYPQVQAGWAIEDLNLQ